MTDIFLSTFPHTSLALFCCEASSSFCIFYFGSVHFVCAVPCVCMCVFVRNSMHYLHRICEPEIKPCFSVWGNRCVWGGGCCFLSMGAVSNLYLCLQNTISIAVVFLILACSLRCKMKAHLICYRSKMTEHKVIPVLECHPLASSA